MKAFADGHPMELLERCYEVSLSPGGLSLSSSSSSIMAPVMKGQYGAFGGVTLEKSKLDMTQKQSTSSPEVCLYRFRFVSFLLTLILGIFVLGYKWLGC